MGSKRKWQASCLPFTPAAVILQVEPTQEMYVYIHPVPASTDLPHATGGV